MKSKLSIFLLSVAQLSLASGPLNVHDIFGRDVGARGQILTVDWDGYIANPAVRLRITGPQAAPEGTYPIGVRIHANNPCVYFDRAGTTNAQGSDRVLSLKDAKSSVDVYLGVWPDRDSQDEEIPIQLLSRDSKGVTANQPMTVYVMDEDGDEPDAEQLSIQRQSPYPFLATSKRAPDIRPPSPFYVPQSTLRTPAPFNIMMDTSYDKTGVMNSDEQARRTARQALDDWAYFLKSLDVDPVDVGEEKTAIVDFKPGTTSWETQAERIVTNQVPFKDMLFYIVSTMAPASRAACTSATQSGYLSKGSTVYGLKRSGVVLLSFAPPGFDSRFDDTNWWNAFIKKSDGTLMDLYSTILHEGGHGLGISVASRLGRQWYDRGHVDNFAIEYYMGRPLAFSRESHLVSGQEMIKGKDEPADIPEIDPLSGKPGFGGVRGWMQHRRWIITKLDLLVLKALGYAIRDTSALRDLKMQAEVPAYQPIGAEVKFQLAASGGVPAYDWDVELGHLPPGLTLDRFTGVVSGVPHRAGLYNFVVRLRDSSVVDTQAERRAFQMRITNPQRPAVDELI